MDPAALKFLLDEINRRFDEADARINRLFDKLQQPAHLLGSLPSASFDLPATPLSVDHFSDISASVPMLGTRTGRVRRPHACLLGPNGCNVCASVYLCATL